jgi:hypothetical protein
MCVYGFQLPSQLLQPKNASDTDVQKRRFAPSRPKKVLREASKAISDQNANVIFASNKMLRILMPM